MAAPAPPEILTGWKEIAAYLGVEKSTAQRWAKSRGLPVRYLPGSSSRVVADRSELDAWRLRGPSVHESPDAAPQPAVRIPLPRRARRWIYPAVGAAVLAAIAAYGWFHSRRVMGGFRVQGSTLVATTAEGEIGRAHV